MIILVMDVYDVSINDFSEKEGITLGVCSHNAIERAFVT